MGPKSLSLVAETVTTSTFMICGVAFFFPQIKVYAFE